MQKLKDLLKFMTSYGLVPLLLGLTFISSTGLSATISTICGVPIVANGWEKFPKGIIDVIRSDLVLLSQISEKLPQQPSPLHRRFFGTPRENIYCTYLKKNVAFIAPDYRSVSESQKNVMAFHFEKRALIISHRFLAKPQAFRLAAYIHEAAHNHWQHVICPATYMNYDEKIYAHPDAGYKACDLGVESAYGVFLVWLKNIQMGCTVKGCSQEFQRDIADAIDAYTFTALPRRKDLNDLLADFNTLLPKGSHFKPY